MSQGSPFLCEYKNESIKFGIEEILQKPLQAGRSKKRCCRNLNLLQRFLHNHQLGTALPVLHPRGHCFSDVLSALNTESSRNPAWLFFPSPPPPHKLNCWNMSMTRSLFLCKHGISLFGYPCRSHALMKPCELRVLFLLLADWIRVHSSWLN